MSIVMFFRAADGVLVVGDGREVAQTDAGFVWRSDRARKLTSYTGSAPVIGAAVGLAALGVGEAQKDVLHILDGVLDDERPSFGMAAGAGPWTSKSVAHAALQEAEHLLGGAGLGDSVVLARVVDWQVGAADPTMWGFELRSVEVDEDGLTIKATSSSTTEFECLAMAGLCSVPESAVWQLVRDRLDRTMSLLQKDVEVDDPRWAPPFFTEASKSLNEVSGRVAEVLADLCAIHPEVFLECQVGGDWVFAELRPGSAPTFSDRSLGPSDEVLSSLD